MKKLKICEEIDECVFQDGDESKYYKQLYNVLPDNAQKLLDPDVLKFINNVFTGEAKRNSIGYEEYIKKIKKIQKTIQKLIKLQEE